MSFDEVLEFWFGAQHEGFADDAHRQLWFAGGTPFDAQINERFADAPAAAARGDLDSWLAKPRGRLAYILVCDQFPRNLYRDDARAFATDSLARGAAVTGIELTQDRQLGFDERAFFYLPFEHSENLIDQHTSVGLFAQLRDETAANYRHLTGGYLRHAHQHRDVVLRFGRFPYRNPALGRSSTAAERDYIEAASRSDPSAS